MSYLPGTKIDFRRVKISQPKKHRLWDIGTHVVFIRAVESAAYTMQLKMAPSAA